MAYDACYHAACDTIANVNSTSVDQLGDAAAHAALAFAMTTSSVGVTEKASTKAVANGIASLSWQVTRQTK